jgi:hypothetical protein
MITLEPMHSSWWEGCPPRRGEHPLAVPMPRRGSKGSIAPKPRRGEDPGPEGPEGEPVGEDPEIDGEGCPEDDEESPSRQASEDTDQV